MFDSLNAHIVCPCCSCDASIDAYADEGDTIIVYAYCRYCGSSSPRVTVYADPRTVSTERLYAALDRAVDLWEPE